MFFFYIYILSDNKLNCVNFTHKKVLLGLPLIVQ